MVLAGSSPTDAVAATDDKSLTPEDRIGTDATDLLRNAPSGNIVPFRGSSLDDLPTGLREHGERIGWQLLSLAPPRLRLIVTLANRVGGQPWRTLLRKSRQPLKADFETWVNRKLNYKYREVRLGRGQFKGATLVGLPAVVRFPDRQDVKQAMLDILARRVQHHGLPDSLR